MMLVVLPHQRRALSELARAYPELVTLRDILETYRNPERLEIANIAQTMYGSDDVRVEDFPLVDRANGGYWVSAHLWVDDAHRRQNAH